MSGRGMVGRGMVGRGRCMVGRSRCMVGWSRCMVGRSRGILSFSFIGNLCNIAIVVVGCVANMLSSSIWEENRV